MKTLSQLKTYLEQCATITRDEFVSGAVRIGDIVEHVGGKGEVINLGSNYLTLVESGDLKKIWVTDVKRVVGHSGDNVVVCSESHVTFKNKKVCLSQRIIKNIPSRIDEGKEMAFYNFVVSLESLVNATPKRISEDFTKYKNDYNRVVKYSSEFSVDTKAVLDLAESMLLTEYFRKK